MSNEHKYSPQAGDVLELNTSQFLRELHFIGADGRVSLLHLGSMEIERHPSMPWSQIKEIYRNSVKVYPEPPATDQGAGGSE